MRRGARRAVVDVVFLQFLWVYVVPFLVVLTVLVFVHEMGHYLVARLNGVRVEVFSIGFGPELVGRTDRSGTRWKIASVPLGGYVKFFGDAGAASNTSGVQLASMDAAERAVSFNHKRLGQRTAIVLAGPAANFVFAIVLFAGLFVFVGRPSTPPIVDSVTPGSAAAEAGFAPGDRIVEIDGSEITRFQEMQRIVRLGLDRRLEVVVRRGGDEVVLTVVPRIVELKIAGTTQRIGQLGIVNRSGREFERYGVAEALWHASVETVAISGATLQAIGEMVVGTRSTDELGGPVRIAKFSGEFCQSLIACIGFAALLSINLGLINLFPVPMLDGGHLLFYSFEALRGKPLAERLQDLGIRIGFALVIVLFLFVTWNDLVHIDF